MAGLLVIFVAWVFPLASGATAVWVRRRGSGSGNRLRARVMATLAAVEDAAVTAVLIDRHGRQWSEGVARLWPFRIYIASGTLLLLALALCLYQVRHLWRGERNVAAPIFAVCSALPFWLIFSGLGYSG